MHNDSYFLRESLKIAALSLHNGNLPFGCILVDAAGNIIKEAENTVVTDNNAIAHCEVNLVNRLASKYPEDFLQTCTVYASTEPCPMCAAAIFWSGIGRIVFALGKDKYRETAGTTNPSHLLELSAEDVLSKGGRKVKVEGPLLEEEAISFYKNIYK
jgi:tRNA(Arg) A34 adenosine deaminase TadA